MIFGVINVSGVYYFEKNKKTSAAMWEALFFISMGSFLFMTGMLERYAFAGIVFGLLAVIGKPKLFGIGFGCR